MVHNITPCTGHTYTVHVLYVPMVQCVHSYANVSGIATVYLYSLIQWYRVHIHTTYTCHPYSVHVMYIHIRYGTNSSNVPGTVILYMYCISI